MRRVRVFPTTHSPTGPDRVNNHYSSHIQRHHARTSFWMADFTGFHGSARHVDVIDRGKSSHAKLAHAEIDKLRRDEPSGIMLPVQPG
jgi:hypothetical protein